MTNLTVDYPIIYDLVWFMDWELSYDVRSFRSSFTIEIKHNHVNLCIKIQCPNVNSFNKTVAFLSERFECARILCYD